MDFTFMKTGFDTLENSGLDISKGFQDKVMALLLTLIEKSLQTASQYVKLARRNGVTSDDFLRCLQYESSRFLDTDDLDETIRMYYQELSQLEESDEEMEDETGEEPTEGLETTDPKDPIDPFVESDSTDTLTQEIHRVHRNWESYRPDDVVKRILKNAIDRFLQDGMLSKLRGH